jgi:hypothetical protein
MSDDAPSVQLQGWLPGEENNGLMVVGETLMEAFDEADRIGEDTTAVTLTLVVGLIEVVGSQKRKKPKEPIVYTRLVRLEVVKPGADYQTVRGVLDAIHDKRIGNTPLPGMGNDDDPEQLDDDELLEREREAAAREAAEGLGEQ